jgi:DNA-binding NarL/FixJ family response regulator
MSMVSVNASEELATSGGSSEQQVATVPSPSVREAHLSPREQSVFALICHGMNDKTIARELDIAPETVKSHAKNILTKLRAKNRAEAVALLYRV